MKKTIEKGGMHSDWRGFTGFSDSPEANFLNCFSMLQRIGKSKEVAFEEALLYEQVPRKKAEEWMKKASLSL